MVKLYDLSQPWSQNSIAWPGYASAVVRWYKRFPEHNIYAQFIETPLHFGTHLDAPLHAQWGGKDVASIPLEQLYGTGVIVDVSDVGRWGIIKPHNITDKVDVKEGDILVWHTGYYKYAETDELEYCYRHPGPDEEFLEWALKMKIKLIMVDCASADHPMNTWYVPVARPDMVKQFEKHVGKKLEEVFPRQDKDGNWKCHPMHYKAFPKGLIHVENCGGDIAKLLNRRVTLGAFPFKFVGGEAAFCRPVAFVEE